ncbi:MAG TPA: MarR family transcriptional regulator [Solirubrobacteraceae bacterium]|nr:MarR family transcriptional regulator [Solirubrobacteraceae bacterium]
MTSLPAQLLAGVKWFEAGLLARLEAEGWSIRAPHSHLFAHLDLDTGTRPSELARRMGVTRQAVHQTVGELRELGLVELEDAGGGTKRVVLTDRGRENVAAARAAFADLERELARRIGAKHVTALREALGRDWGPPV